MAITSLSFMDVSVILVKTRVLDSTIALSDHVFYQSEVLLFAPPAFALFRNCCFVRSRLRNKLIIALIPVIRYITQGRVSCVSFFFDGRIHQILFRSIVVYLRSFNLFLKRNMKHQKVVFTESQYETGRS